MHFVLENVVFRFILSYEYTFRIFICTEYINCKYICICICVYLSQWVCACIFSEKWMTCSTEQWKIIIHSQCKWKEWLMRNIAGICYINRLALFKGWQVPTSGSFSSMFYKPYYVLIIVFWSRCLLDNARVSLRTQLKF